MIKQVLILVVFIIIDGCASTSPIQFVSADKAHVETLITIENKTPRYGLIEFLKVEEDKFRMLTYSYLVDYKTNTLHCTMLSNELYSFDSEAVQKSWMTTSELRKQKYYESCFKLIYDKFLDLSNDKKIELLNRIIITGSSNRNAKLVNQDGE